MARSLSPLGKFVVGSAIVTIIVSITAYVVTRKDGPQMTPLSAPARALGTLVSPRSLRLNSSRTRGSRMRPSCRSAAASTDAASASPALATMALLSYKNNL